MGSEVNGARWRARVPLMESVGAAPTSPPARGVSALDDCWVTSHVAFGERQEDHGLPIISRRILLAITYRTHVQTDTLANASAERAVPITTDATKILRQIPSRTQLFLTPTSHCFSHKRSRQSARISLRLTDAPERSGFKLSFPRFLRS